MLKRVKIIIKQTILPTASIKRIPSIESDGAKTLMKSNKIVMYESGDTPTENAVMAAVLAEGETIIKFASANYMVQDICYFLKTAGAKIEGIGTTTLKITGVDSLQSVEEYFVSPDPVDAMAWISLAITTKSKLTIKNCPLDFLELEMQKLEVMGQEFKISGERKSKNGQLDLIDIEIIPSEELNLKIPNPNIINKSKPTIINIKFIFFNLNK